ncbi:serine/threonine protein kinase [Streptomyces sp. NBC_01275]|uniref:serine/threonine-protein kinase n=1 Tax=Streptomyces sp. NBC_01275 TaxID=2903807 RepID=UPI0022559ADC|nr:serine/threonine-protein kinase [Streptomyces sp. NBC_01275]MCX4764429.1 serine/threonine protein kinase [Streptomyces sp. NBC_01275]
MSNGGDPGGDKGRTVSGRYRLLERIGSGGMGTVWRAYDELMEREVAVKQPRLPGDPEDEAHRRAAHRLYREARAAARVDHPSAVSVYDVVVEGDPDVEGGLPWIVMELIRGESLHELLRRGPLDPVESARIGLAVLGALRAAHAVGIVHRDVKPANVLLGPNGRVVLTDFGIAHIQGEESLTASGEFVGSLEFIAPERMSGRGAGPASDLWSLGVLLYAAVEGWSPFRRTTVESTLAAILAADPPEPKQAGPLAPLVVRLLARAPEARPGPETVAAALEAVAAAGAAESEETKESEEDGAWAGTGVGAEAGAGAGAGAEAGAEAGVEPQDVGWLREFGEDVGTVRVGPAGPDSTETPGSDLDPDPGFRSGSGPGSASGPHPHPHPHPEPDPDPVRDVDLGSDLAPGPDSAPDPGSDDPGSDPDPDPASDPGPGPDPDPGPRIQAQPSVSRPRPRPLRPFPLRPLPLALLVGVLVSGAWLGTSLLRDSDGRAIGGQTATYSSAPAAPGTSEASSGPVTPSVSPDPWQAHRETGLDAVLSLPSRYRETARQDDASDQPRLVVYSAGSIDVRLTQWDSAPDAPMARAAQAHEIWSGYAQDARTQTTRTSFHGDEAALADTTYGLDEVPTRVMELFVRTDDSRMYELRVDMPKGTPQEKQGTAVFKEARGRLEIGAG